MRETRVQSLGLEDPLEKEVASHSSILAWGGGLLRSLVNYSPWGREELDTTERLHFTSSPIPVFLPGESHGQKSLVSYSPHSITAERLTLSNRANYVTLFSIMQCTG